MVLDLLENLKNYAALNPNFAKAVEFIENNDLAALPLGRNEICGDLVFANVMEVAPKSKQEARIEIHRRYIDIQVPVTGDEVMGYSPLDQLPPVEFDEAGDFALYPVEQRAREFFNVRQGEFVIFFPQDGHAPAITDAPLKKIVVKVAVE